MIYVSYLLMTLLGFLGLFMIVLILLQRGRGGGLAGAFGGAGGQSWAGTKAGDLFTRITIGVASAWILLCAGSVVALHNTGGQRSKDLPDRAAIKAEDAKTDAKAGDESNEDAKTDSSPVREGAESLPPLNSKPEGNDSKSSGTEKPVEDQKPADAKAEEKAESKPVEETKTPAVPEGEQKAEEPKN